MAARVITLKGVSVRLAGGDFDFMDSKWRLRWDTQNPVDSAQIHQSTDTFSGTEITAALAALGQQTVTDATTLAETIQDLNEQLMRTRYPD